MSESAVFNNRSQRQEGQLNSGLSGYQSAQEAAAAKNAQANEDYERFTKTINSKFAVLKELSKFAIDVLIESREGQSAAGFADTGSLISELIAYSESYTLTGFPDLPGHSRRTRPFRRRRL